MDGQHIKNSASADNGRLMTPSAMWEERIVEAIKTMELRLDEHGVLRSAIPGRYPLKRYVSEPLTNVDPNARPPYECIVSGTTNREYCFGYPIHKFSANELIEACRNDTNLDNSLHREYHAKYEFNGEIRGALREKYLNQVTIPGYCKSKQCRETGVHALSGGEYCRYYCATCLAAVLRTSYSQAELGTCAVFCMPSVDVLEDFGSVVTNVAKLDVRFNDGKAQINNTGVEGYFIRVPPRVRERDSNIYWTFPWMLVVTTPIVQTVGGANGTKPQMSLYLGLYRANLRGRYVCRNLALGLECLHKQRETERFCERAVPPYYPSWIEQGPTDEVPGLIDVGTRCWACSEPRDLEYYVHEKLMAINPTYRQADTHIRAEMRRKEIQRKL